jgi:hypothetical protein
VAAAAPAIAPMIAIRQVLNEVRDLEKSLHSRLIYGGTPSEPFPRPMTPPVDYFSPWLLRKRRAVLELIAKKLSLQFWENRYVLCMGRGIFKTVLTPYFKLWGVLLPARPC